MTFSLSSFVFMSRLENLILDEVVTAEEGDDIYFKVQNVCEEVLDCDSEHSTNKYCLYLTLHICFVCNAAQLKTSVVLRR